MGIRTIHTIDADNKVAGRLATHVARLLMGKHKVSYQPHTDCGDQVVVMNVEKIHFTGNKMTGKIYRHHTMHPGGLKEAPLSERFAKDPRKLFREIVEMMLPKNKLQKRMLKRLRILRSSDHV